VVLKIRDAEFGLVAHESLAAAAPTAITASRPTSSRELTSAAISRPKKPQDSGNRAAFYW
jgi:hypothetical protein